MELFLFNAGILLISVVAALYVGFNTGIAHLVRKLKEGAVVPVDAGDGTNLETMKILKGVIVTGRELVDEINEQRKSDS